MTRPHEPALDAVARDESYPANDEAEGAIGVLARGCAFNWAYQQTRSVEKAIAYAAKNGLAASQVGAARSLVAGLHEAGYRIVSSQGDAS